MKKKCTIILDLDGVLITTPPWKPDPLDTDGYSRFNEKCIANLNQLLQLCETEIWLSSTRRTNKTLEEFNQIFKHRKILTPITGFLPENTLKHSRKEEVEFFLLKNNFINYLVIDDDKSLNDLSKELKDSLVLTQYMKGFDEECLKEAIQIVNQL